MGRARMTEEELRRMLAKGNCRVIGDTKPVAAALPLPKPKEDAKTALKHDLRQWCKDRELELMAEYRFHPVRKWRLDFFIPSLNIGIEYEGIFSEKSRHTTLKGYTGDVVKYNEAVKQGIRVLRYTAGNAKEIINDLESIFSTLRQ